MNLNPKWLWTKAWMRGCGTSGAGRFCARMAAIFAPPYKGLRYLAGLHPQGYIHHTVRLYGAELRRGQHVFVGEGVTIFGRNGGPIALGDRVNVHQDTIIEVGPGGSLHVGPDTHIQPRCQFSCYESPIAIGAHVQIAPYCSFYPYDHGLAPDKPVMEQPLHTKGGIVVEDHVTFGIGVTVLDGVRIGRGAVIGANAMVMHDIPANAIAIGVPARVVRMRGELPTTEDGAA